MIYVLIGIGLALLLFIIWLASVDGSYYVTRSIDVNISKEKAFELISDFNTWTLWSPWLCMEPNANVKINNDGKGLGTVYSWSGKIVGAGEIEHKKILDQSSLEQEIRFIKPFKSKSDVFWFIEDKEDASNITWGMKGKMPFFFKFMAKNMEPWIGMDYERGLKMIKDLLEKGNIASQINIHGVDLIPEAKYLGLKASCKMQDVGSSMQKTFGQLHEYTDSNAIETNKALAVYHNFDFKNPNCEYTAGVVTDADIKNTGSELFISKTNSQKAVKVIFTGDYNHLGNAWSAAYAYARNKHLKVKKGADPIEFYLTDPQKEPDHSKWITEVYLPIK